MTDAMGPTPFLKGTFALYELPDGGRMLAYREDGSEDTNRFVIPAALMKLVEAQQRGEKVNPLQLMKSMMTGK